MKKELEKKLIEEFPSFFRDMYGDSRKTCLDHGLAVEDGWFDLIHETCVKIKNYCDVNGGDFKFSQIKQKFATLVFHADYNGSTFRYPKSELSIMIDAAEFESAKICEICGTRENVEAIYNSWATRCPKCMDVKSSI